MDGRGGWNMPVENLYTTDCIRTFTGLYMNVFEPTPDMICIEDIAHALSHQCRFGGHLPKFYSVAEHCVAASVLANNANKLAALLHDASEAYLLDIPRPIKHRLSNYKEIENNLMALIAEKFGFEWPLSENVKRVDEYLLQWEWHTIMIDTNSSYLPYSSKGAEEMFLQKFTSLSKPHGQSK